MKIFTGRKRAIITAMVLYTATSAVILSCGCVGDGIGIAFLKEGGHFNPDANYSSFKDPRDGKTYKTVVINGVTWMAENLNYATSDSWCFDNKNSLCEVYGRLYTWEAAKSACASMGGGWRLPTRADWDNLVTHAGGSSTAGKKLKAKSGWYDNGNGTDDYGFSALPGGYRYSDGSFDDAGNNGFWWSATEYGSDRAYSRYMYYYNGSVGEYYVYRSYGFSVRCVGVAQD